MTTLFEKKSECCGCSACVKACPAGAAAMACDTEGFLYPRIDNGLCKDCGACQKACEFKRVTDEKTPPLGVYAAKHTNNAVRRSSTSGGVFTALSDVILGRGGAVYGAAFTEGMRVAHQRASSKEQRDGFKGSKYVQSDPGGTFEMAERDLAEGRQVLFSGTPCQIGGLSGFLKRKPSVDLKNLYLCDFICYGVPSPLLWSEHVRFLEKKNKSRMVGYSFRSKRSGWNSPVEEGIYENGRADSRSLISQLYMRLFYKGHIFRPSCHACPYTTAQRQSDVTIGDFWGIEEVMGDFHDPGGVSLVMANTKRGRALLDGAARDLELRPCAPEDALRSNLKNPAPAAPDRDRFWADFSDKGYEYIIKRYANYNCKGYAKWTAKKLLRSLGR